MKFIYADAIDQVDPNFDFLADRSAASRRPYWDDVYAHELFEKPPYDGLLVSRGIVGDARMAGKYSEAQSMRFHREGARKFLRLDALEIPIPVFGDCGAFTYKNEELPPYAPEDTAEFYECCGFTYGCSIDHIIFEYNDRLSRLDGGTPESKRRWEITLDNAAEFIALCRSQQVSFEPIGVVQGWSPSSMAEAAKRLETMGYDYVAIGGLVPLRAEQVLTAFAAVRDALNPATRVHLLGFAKADHLEQFANRGVESFDSTSPLLRAFKDSQKNYYLPRDGKLDYYTAIRIPQALENTKLKRLVAEGGAISEELVDLEQKCLNAIRGFDRRECSADEVLAPLMEYSAYFVCKMPLRHCSADRRLLTLQTQYMRTLAERPWNRCHCEVCSYAGVETIIFRGSNRNRRRGMHNLHVFHQHSNRIDKRPTKHEEHDLFRN